MEGAWEIAVLHCWFLHIAVDTALIELRLEIMTKAFHLQYRVDHPNVFRRSAQEGAIVH